MDKTRGLLGDWVNGATTISFPVCISHCDTSKGAREAWEPSIPSMEAINVRCPQHFSLFVLCSIHKGAHSNTTTIFIYFVHIIQCKQQHHSWSRQGDTGVLTLPQCWLTATSQCCAVSHAGTALRALRFLPLS